MKNISDSIKLPHDACALLLGAGELGKEVAIELQRLGITVIAVDRYADAPAMQVAHRSHTCNMLDGAALTAIIEKEQPHYIIPEIEAIATDALVKLETAGWHVIPIATAAQLTMNRQGIRQLAADELGLRTSPYQFAEDYQQFCTAIDKIGFPCVIKPIMSSSGKGQSVVRSTTDIEQAWEIAQLGGRAGKGRVIIEGFIDFDMEITLLTVRAVDGIHFCQPIGHHQQGGDYRQSWQPQALSAQALLQAKTMAEKIVNRLGGYGLFGVEFFIDGDEVFFSEVSPRPHDTGMVTMISQDLSEFALHVRASLGLPIGHIQQLAAAASCVITGNGKSCRLSYDIDPAVFQQAGTQLRLFAKPDIDGERRLGVALATADTVEAALEKARLIAASVSINYE